VIDVFNNSDKPYRARVSVSPFTYTREGFKALTSSPNDLTSYLRFSPRELVVAPGQKRSIRFNARILPSLPKEEYRAMFSIQELKESQTESQSKTNQVGIDVTIVSTIYVRNGDLVPVLTVPQVVYDRKSKEIRLLVKNAGKATTRAKTDWNLSQNGQTLNSGKLEETTIIAEGDRYIRIAYPPEGQAIKVGAYQLSGQLSWDFPNKGGNLPFNVNFNIADEETQPTKPIQPTKPTKPVQPTKPNKPIK
jgi:hypothetical protein